MLGEEASRVKKNVDDLLALPKPCRCEKFNRAVHMKSKEAVSKRVVAKLSCGCFSCRACGARKKLASGRHVAAKLLTAAGGIFESESLPEEWQAQRKRLQRLKASWVRYGPSHLPGVIIGVTPSTFGTLFCDRERAIIRLGEVIASMKPERKDEGSRCRPINYSRDWTPPESEAKYDTVGWLRVTSPGAFVQALRELGISPLANLSRDAEWDITFGIPPDLAECQKLKLLLSCPR